MSLKAVNGYESLTDDQKALFERVFANHMAMRDTDAKKEYAAENLKEVKWDAKEKCLKVYYKNGDWWHYLPDGTWF
jgi:hypothetical protein